MIGNDWRKEREAGGCNYITTSKIKEVFLKEKNGKKGRADSIFNKFFLFVLVLAF